MRKCTFFHVDICWSLWASGLWAPWGQGQGIHCASPGTWGWLASSSNRKGFLASHGALSHSRRLASVSWENFKFYKARWSWKVTRIEHTSITHSPWWLLQPTFPSSTEDLKWESPQKANNAPNQRCYTYKMRQSVTVKELWRVKTKSRQKKKNKKPLPLF